MAIETKTPGLIEEMFGPGAPELWLSLHVDNPGPALGQEVSYPGYARQRFRGTGYTDFPQCPGGSYLVITWAALSDRRDGPSRTLLAVALTPPITLRGGVAPGVAIRGDFPPPPEQPAEQPPARMGSRFEALVAEMGLDEGATSYPGEVLAPGRRDASRRDAVKDEDLPHAFVRGRFRRGERGGQTPEETCDVCGRDPRNVVHRALLPGVVYTE